MSRCQVTLSVNAGVALHLGRHRIWSDALHDRRVVGFSTVTPEIWNILQAHPDFARPEVLFYTHCHPDHYSRAPYEVRPFGGYTVLEDMDLARSFELARLLTELFRSGEVDEVNFVYTEFRSMLSQVPVVKKILPLSFEDEEDAPAAFGAVEFDPSPAAVLGRIIPQYVGGMVFGAVSEAFASEQGARRMAMENASDNAEEMIASLSLQYNRARQGAITQEITEISSGFEALR